MEGFVYVLSNPCMPDLFKIGYTANDPADRAKALSRDTGVPMPFKVEHIILTDDCEATEQSAHLHFGKGRVNRNREFFKAPLLEIKHYLWQFDFGYQPTVFFDSHVEAHVQWLEAEAVRLEGIRQRKYAKLVEARRVEQSKKAFKVVLCTALIGIGILVSMTIFNMLFPSIPMDAAHILGINK